jgi:hypothetical protein
VVFSVSPINQNLTVGTNVGNEENMRTKNIIKKMYGLVLEVCKKVGTKNTKIKTKQSLNQE